MRPIRVTATQEIIDNALQANKHRCAAAVALKFADNDFERIRVDQNTIRLSSRSEQLRYTWVTPPQVRRYIDAFDLDKSQVQPFAFTLDPKKAVSVKPVEKQNATGLVRRSSRPKPHVRKAGQSTAARGAAA